MRSLLLRRVVVITAALCTSLAEPASACTRALYVADDGTVLTGRNMDWIEDMGSNLWAFPAGMKRNGAAGPNSIQWTSLYGSVITSGYDVSTVDGLNDKGLVANMQYLADADYGQPAAGKPLLTVAAWPQYVLDNYATVAEAVAALSKEPFSILSPTLPNGIKVGLHLSISDASGDSAIFEYVKGKLVIHHGKQYVVMTNQPIYDQQLARNEYWESIGGLRFLPGTFNPSDRFARASYYVGAIPRKADPHYIKGMPDQSFVYQAVASMLGVMRTVSVPIGVDVVTPSQPNASSSIWTTVSDSTHLTYYFESASRPNTFWVSLSKLDLKPSAPVKKLTISHGEIFSGEVSAKFTDAEPFKFLPGQPPAN